MGCGFWIVKQQHTTQLFFPFSAASGHQSYAGSHTFSKTVETEISALSSPPKSQNIGCQSGLLSFPREKPGVEFCSQPRDTMPGVGILMRRCHEFSYWLWCTWFHACLGCRSLLTDFWISHKENWSLYCYWIDISVGGRMKWGFLFCHLPDFTPPPLPLLCFFSKS